MDEVKVWVTHYNQWEKIGSNLSPPTILEQNS
jgi:hypothetical protein